MAVEEASLVTRKSEEDFLLQVSWFIGMIAEHLDLARLN
jgi:hypothetical protein